MITRNLIDDFAVGYMQQVDTILGSGGPDAEMDLLLSLLIALGAGLNTARVRHVTEYAIVYVLTQPLTQLPERIAQALQARARSRQADLGPGSAGQ